jgi:hypothetical protein
MGVVGEDHERALLCCIAHQLVGRERDQKRVRFGPARDAERHLQSAPLGRGQQLQQTQDRIQKLMQTREGELRFCLDAHGGQGPKAKSVRSSPGVAQQRRFPDPGLARDHQRGPAVRKTLDDRVDARCLGIASDQLESRRAKTRPGHCTSICG